MPALYLPCICPTSALQNCVVPVLIPCSVSSFLVCKAGAEVKFATEGAPSEVHLTGFYEALQEDDDFLEGAEEEAEDEEDEEDEEEEDEEEEEEDEEEPVMPSKKRKGAIEVVQIPSKKAKQRR